MSDTLRELADVFAGLARDLVQVPEAAHAATNADTPTTDPGPDQGAGDQMNQIVDLLLSIEDGESRQRITETLTRWRAAATPVPDIPWFCRV